MRLRLLLVALLLSAAPAVAQQDTASLREIRQRATWALDRAENMGDEADVLAEHLRQLIESLTAQIKAGPLAPKLPGGEPAEEPLPPQHGGALLYSDGFESVPVAQRVEGRGANGFQWRGGFRTIVVSDDHAYSGAKSLRFDYPGEARCEDSTREQRFRLGPGGTTHIDEVWVEFMVRVPDNFHQRSDCGSSNNKLLALWAEIYGSGTAEQEGYALFEYRRQTQTSSYLACSAGSGPDRAFDQNMTVKGTVFSAALAGQWVRLRFHVKLGYPAVMEAWRGTEKVADMPADWDMTATDHPYLRLGYLFGWANSGFDEDTNFYLDDFKIWTQDPEWTF